MRLGSTHRPLGLAALTCGEVERAVEHFTAAITANERYGHRPATIQARAERRNVITVELARAIKHRGHARIPAVWE